MNFHVIFFRLSITDPHARSDQPMTDRSARFVLAFNGEIYNFRELRSEMARTGASFQTSGDAEVLLQGLIKEGAGFVRRLQGMFAFVFWDRTAGTLLAARDPFGIKPLYFLRDHECLVFASEPKPLRFLAGSRVAPESIPELLVFRHHSGHALFEGIHSVEPGQVLLGHPGSPRTLVYADPVASLLSETGSDTASDLPAAVGEDLSASIKSHTAGLEKVALQLSGGIDSSLIAALCSDAGQVPIQAFGLSIEGDEYDEGPAQEFVASRCGIDYVRIPFGQDDFTSRLQTCISALDAPSPHYGCVALDLLSSIAARSHKAILVGEGADELFGGYSRYLRCAEFSPIPQSLVPGFRHTPDSVLFATAYAGIRPFESLFPSMDFSFRRRTQLAQKHAGVTRQLAALDLKCYLPSLLMRQDRISMAHGIEARTPYLHLPLLERLVQGGLTARLPSAVTTTKPILKRIAESRFPKQFVHRAKNGLALPIREWLKAPGPLRDLMAILIDRDARLSDYADMRRLQNAVRQFLKGGCAAIDAAVLMQVLNVELWLRTLRDRSRSRS